MTAGVRAVDARPEVVCASAGELRGDLDWITMRALEKDRTRRYGSASDLAADLRRHLDNLPVLASPPGRLYRVRKFVRRHRAGVATAAAGLALLITFSALVTIQARRIAVERDRANLEAETSRQVSDFLVGLFKVVDPRQAKGEAVTAREILDKGAESIKAALGSQPETQARLMATLGTVYGSIGLYELAERLLREALQIQERDLGDAHASTLSTKRELALTLSMAGRSAEADRLAIDAVKGLERSAGPDHIETLMAKRVLFAVRQRQGRAKEAEALSMELLQAQRRVLGADHPETLRHLSDIANMYYDLKRYEESATLASEVLDTRRRLFGDSHPDTLTSSNNLAVAYQHLGRYAEAQPLMERTIAGAERVLGPKHPTYGIYVHSLGELMLAKGDLASAERHLRRALVIYELQTGHEFLGLVLYELAQVCAKQNKTDQALSFLERAVSEGYQHNGKRLGFVDDPALVALRGDARFQKAVADANRRPPR
jgi:non-specific serine/threonine protein kinase/serine/threonine-protein kinase